VTRALAAAYLSRPDVTCIRCRARLARHLSGEAVVTNVAADVRGHVRVYDARRIVPLCAVVLSGVRGVRSTT
jgi:hypothetical protein